MTREERRFTAEQPPSMWEAQVNAVLSTAPLRCPFCGGAGEWIATCDDVERQPIPGDSWYEYLARPRAAEGTGWQCVKCGRVSIDPTERVNAPDFGWYAPCTKCGKVSEDPWCSRCGTRLEWITPVAHATRWRDGEVETRRCVQYVEDGIVLGRHATQRERNTPTNQGATGHRPRAAL